MSDPTQTAAPTRMICYADGRDLDASRAFYTEVLGLDVAMEDPVLGLTSAANRTAQVLIPPAGFDQPQPRFGIDLGQPRAVDTAHSAAHRRGLRVVYPITDEPWGVRRFFVEDPSGTIINVLAHIDNRPSASSPTMRVWPRLIVADPDRASAFYQDALGAEQVFRGPPIDDGRPAVIEHRISDTLFRVSPAVTAWDWLSPSDLGGSPVLLEIEVDDADALSTSMVDHGSQVIVPIENRPYGKRSGRIRDPLGHLWIITGELR